MNMTPQAIAECLLDARDRAAPLPAGLRQTFTEQEAYEVQQRLTRLKEARGSRRVGRKIGLTSRAMQRQFGIESPDYGNLFDDELFLQGTPIDTARFIEPRVEGEIAFLLKKDLTGPRVTVSDVLAATEGVMACAEIIDNRWGPGFTVLDSIADNASCGGFLLGSKLLPLKDLDLRLVAMLLRKNGELVHSGASVEVMGDPLNAVAWLASQLSAHGSGLKAGEIVLSGAITAAVPVQAGDCVSICFSQLGDIHMMFR